MTYCTIPTPFYSKKAHEVLSSVIGQTSDGWGENNPHWEKYWKFVKIETEPNGQVVIKIANTSGEYDKWSRSGWLTNGFNRMSGDEIIQWFAKLVKKTMQMELKDDNVKNGWKRDNDSYKTQYLAYDEEISVSDVYFIYDTLLGRDTARKYSVAQHMKIEGLPKSEADTKIEENRRQKLDKIDAKLHIDVADLEAWKKEQISIIEKEYIQKRTEISNKWREARAKV